MISKRFFWTFFLGILLVYIVGLFNTLMENDSAQFAVMAQRMVQEDDYLSLVKGVEEYLDKPHLHYWLAAASYKVFGIADWAYRIPALLATLLAAFSCFGMGRLYYSADAGRLAALIFMSAQTIVLSVIDVRTDAVLTGFAAFALWQLLRYLKLGSTQGLFLGALGAGLAFSTKGQIALVVIGLPILVELVYSRKWQRLLNWRLLPALLIFVLVISPVLYAYYQQFDLHPEKVIRGRDNRSGVLFILWEQSFERLSGEGVGKNSSDYFFFFHTFLWVFLPWTLIGITAFGHRVKQLWKAIRGSAEQPEEAWSAGGIALIFILISFAQFKLPHYLNITIPIFAVLAAAYLLSWRSESLMKFLKWSQIVIAFLVLIAIGGICLWVFPLPSYLGILLSLGAAGLLWFSYNREFHLPLRIAGLGLASAILLNAVMNAHFYPRLLEFQAGSEIARSLESTAPEAGPIYKLGDGHTWAMDFYSGSPLRITSPEHLKKSDEVEWIYVSRKQLEAISAMGLDADTILAADQFRITRLQARFLNPDTRSEVLNKRYLLRLKR